MALSGLVAVACLSCASASSSRRPSSPAVRARGFVDTFDRILIAGFISNQATDRGRALDINAEAVRLLRTKLRLTGPQEVLDVPPIDLQRSKAAGNQSEDILFSDVAFWKRLGEEYREPLILTGTVVFKPAGAQYDERTTARGTVRVFRPGFRLSLRLVFISGRTGEVLDRLPLGPARARAPDSNTSVLGLFFQLMDKLAPSVLAAMGR